VGIVSEATTETSRPQGAVVPVSVVIPAHDEARVIGRTLRLLRSGVESRDLDVVVVCNGCTDDTASIARSVPDVRVLEIPEASKTAAVRVGNAASTAFPRVHLDADVEISGADVLTLVRAIQDEELLAAAPARVIPLDLSSWPVRSYYRVWEHLPHVRSGLFGRGVIALSREGQARVDALPPVMSDDLAISDAFSPHECQVVEAASVVVRPPRTMRDLFRRRVRAATGVRQADALGLRRAGSGTSLSTLARLSLREPGLALRVPLFLGVGLAARRRSRRAVLAGDFSTWLRDESSRS
jgi:Glycosyl transferase family 2